MPLPGGKTAKELGLKTGQKFKVVEPGVYKTGDIVTLIKDDGSALPEFKRDIDGLGYYCYLSGLEPLEKTLDNLQEGDVVVESDGERTVLGVCGKVYAMSITGRPEYFSGFYTSEELHALGYKLKTETPPETKELTLQEIADKFNIPVEDLRIKEEK